MKKSILRVAATILTMISTFGLSATHIIGGDFTVQHVADSTFEVTLTLYRDCGTDGAPLDPLLTVYVFEEGTDELMNDLIFDMELDSQEFPPLGDACFTPDICLEVGTYVDQIVLPANPNGYYLVWERCCRNDIISNIQNPGDEGMVFLVTVPDPALENSSPIFLPYPEDGYLCVNSENAIDFSATDADGDSLVYRLETPLSGDATDPLNPNPNVSGPKPHSEVLWLAPYSLDDIVGGVPPMAIDSETGLLTASPEVLGVFVLAVAVDEYRDGQLIGTVRRELQLQSTLCLPPGPPDFVGFGDVDTIQVYPIVENSLDIAVDAGQFEVTAGVAGEIITDGFEPLAFVDTISSGTGFVNLNFNWDEIPCDYIGEFFTLEFVAASYAECLDSTLTDSLLLYIEVIVDPDVPTEFVSPTVDTQTIVYGQSDTYQWPVTVTDGNPTDTLFLSMVNEDYGGIVFQGDTANNVVNSDFFWEVGCDDIQDEPYIITYQTITTYCNIHDTTTYEMELYVTLPEDEPTVFTSPDDTLSYHSISGEQFCIPIIAEDPNNIDTLQLVMGTTNPLFSLPNAPTFEGQTAIFEVGSPFCWQPECVDINPGSYTLDFLVTTTNCDIVQVTPYELDIILFPQTDGSLDLIPNVFTPNDDMVNDVYEILYTPEYCIDSYLIEMYDRWGLLVFESTDRDETWDGKFNDNDVSEGVYYLKVTYNYYGQSKVETSTVQVLRDNP